MKKHLGRFAVSSVAVLTMWLMVQTLGSAQNGPPQVVVSFGLEDATGAANHVLIPDEVTITAGGKVAYQMFGLHQMTIYKVDPGTTRAHIAAHIVRGFNYVIADAAAVLIVDTAKRDVEHPGFIHDHVTSPLILQSTNPMDANVNVLNRNETLNMEVLFRQPGRYLVFCGIKSHLDDQMFGFVNVF
jgi:plastocyanin